MKTRRAMLAGASGLVGGQCLEALLADADYDAVHALVRRPLERAHDKLTICTVDFARLPSAPAQVDDAFCCLGTTMKLAGSHEDFERVDLDYVRNFAQLALTAGATQFLLVSAVGADTRSLVYYNRVKGRAEEAVLASSFRCVHIFRPSLLLGERREDRPGEAFAQTIAPSLAPLLVGPLARYRAVPAATVARHMVDAAKQDVSGVHFHYFTE
jgi:uncharacterized protein YbjT (DUF2867 family)